MYYQRRLFITSLSVCFCLAACNIPTPSPPPTVESSSLFIPPTGAAPTSIHIPGKEKSAPSTLIIAYYPSWKYIEVPPARIPADGLTIINYAFALPGEVGECVPDNLEASKTNFPALLELKTQHPNLKTMISVGGWGADQLFSAATASTTLTDSFVRACVQLMRDNGFDGIDVDWEYPSTEQMSTFTSLLEKLRQALDVQGQVDGRRYLLTIAAPASSYSMTGMDIPKIIPLLDWINLMTYDFYGNWSETTGFNAPLYTSPDDPAQWSADRTIQTYLYLEVPPEKLVLGVPFYGRGWQGVKDVNHGLYQPFSGPPEDSTNGSYSYSQLKQFHIEKIPRYWDEYSNVPWLFDANQGLLISYDDPQSITLKAEYARQHNLGGVMIWEITGDDEAGSLLTAVHEALK